MISRDKIPHTKRWVVKIGSALLTEDGKGLSREILTPWVEQMVTLSRQGIELVLVSSGAVAEGMSRMGWSKRPHNLHELQAAAAIGQMGLIRTYEACFRRHNMHTAQVLLTHEDLADRKRYLNARTTLRTLLSLDVIPVVNENDTVATDELRFGDNDTLAALVANLIEADLLILLTDQEGLYDSDPRINKNATLVSQQRIDSPILDQIAGGSSSALGLGGMITKVRAARLAGRSGTATIIAAGRREEVLPQILKGEDIGTLLTPTQEKQAARKRWLAGQQTRGQLTIDDGAVHALKKSGRSLLPIGISTVSGVFARGAVVACLDSKGREVARGLVNYSSQETCQIKGKACREIEEILGYIDEDELIHRDNLVII